MRTQCIGPSNTGGANIDILRFATRAIKTRSQCSFLLIDVRFDEKSAPRAVILARNADKSMVARETRAPEALFLKKVRNAAFCGSAGPVPSGYGNIDHLSI